MNPPRPQSLREVGFTLVELLVSTVVLSVLLVLIAGALDSIQRTWRSSKARVDQFREARVAFEAITRQLSQATLNTYWDYHFTETGSNLPPEDSNAPPAAYVRQSELSFLCGPSSEIIGQASEVPLAGHALFFQAALGHSANHRGLASLLNGRGFYLQWGDNSVARPGFLPKTTLQAQRRFRLMEYRPVSERADMENDTVPGNTIYQNPGAWHLDQLQRQSRAIATNILALVFSPQSAAETEGLNPWWIAPAYRYNSADTDNSTATIDKITISEDGTVRQGTQHLLPPIVRVTLVAADEDSFSRWVADQPSAGGDLLKRAGAEFTDASKHDNDVEKLKRYLEDQRILHRVFISAVPLRNAQWDRRLAGPTTRS